MHREETADTAPVIRVIRGEAGPEELAALTVVLLLSARGPALSGVEPAAQRAHRPATWRRLERALNHRSARSWRNELHRTRPPSAAGV
ncbi:acyl-CoA carboxylase epsilon subunit [Streptomyces sp. NBC_00557]|uniref:acyl-CoA carboxylase epsilon subunit n=1 Tax=Streptomyces sp. NBC_00557 TaxID=2975776 RepID=UPI002E80D5CD|nr:acyl-CoA carboxylase epsilon subunit [Streptomyces sp. NBC_00557]WUC32827.1 acyl-CoA carboxylase subunit epsilon [Streptomyces sp. NBC_00557]